MIVEWRSAAVKFLQADRDCAHWMFFAAAKVLFRKFRYPTIMIYVGVTNLLLSNFGGLLFSNSMSLLPFAITVSGRKPLS